MALLDTFSDNFNDNSTDVAKWPNNFNGAGNTMTETGQQVVLALGGTSGSYSAYYNGTTTYDLTGSYAVIKAVTVSPDAATNAQNFIKLEKDATNYLAMGKQAGNLYMQRQVAGVDSTTTLTYDTTNHKWWRIRESGGNILWDTSPDGITWTNRRSLANPFVITAMKMQIGAGTFAAQASPGTFTFDEFNTLPAAPSNTNQMFFGILGRM